MQWPQAKSHWASAWMYRMSRPSEPILDLHGPHPLLERAFQCPLGNISPPFYAFGWGGTDLLLHSLWASALDLGWLTRATEVGPMRFKPGSCAGIPEVCLFQLGLLTGSCYMEKVGRGIQKDQALRTLLVLLDPAQPEFQVPLSFSIIVIQ